MNTSQLIISTDIYLRDLLKYQTILLTMYSDLSSFINRSLTYGDLAAISEKSSDIRKFIKKMDFVLKPSKDIYEGTINKMLELVNDEVLVLSRPKFNTYFIKYLDLYPKYKKVYDNFKEYNNISMPDNMKLLIKQVAYTISQKMNYTLLYIATVVGHLQILSNNNDKSLKDITKIFK